MIRRGAPVLASPESCRAFQVTNVPTRLAFGIVCSMGDRTGDAQILRRGRCMTARAQSRRHDGSRACYREESV